MSWSRSILPKQVLNRQVKLGILQAQITRTSCTHSLPTTWFLNSYDQFERSNKTKQKHNNDSYALLYTDLNSQLTYIKAICTLTNVPMVLHTSVLTPSYVGVNKSNTNYIVQIDGNHWVYFVCMCAYPTFTYSIHIGSLLISICILRYVFVIIIPVRFVLILLLNLFIFVGWLLCEAAS